MLLSWLNQMSNRGISSFPGSFSRADETRGYLNFEFEFDLSIFAQQGNYSVPAADAAAYIVENK